MIRYRRTAIVVGILFIIATGFLFIGQSIYGPFLDSQDYLSLAYPHRATVTIGILLEFACVLAIPLIAVFLFPILKGYHETFALGYVGFRFFEAVLYVAVLIKKLTLIDVSQRYLAGGAMGPPYFQEFGSAVRSENAWTFSIYIVVFAFGALMFYSVLYRSRLVPRFIPAWGFLAAALLLVGAILDMVGALAAIPQGVFELIFASPIAVNEMVLAVWLIAKGFRSPAADAELAGAMREETR